MGFIICKRKKPLEVSLPYPIIDIDFVRRIYLLIGVNVKEEGREQSGLICQ